MTDLLVLAQDPRFGGGAAAHAEAFVSGAQALGRTPELLFSPHPTFDGRRLTADRLESVRHLRAGVRFTRQAREAHDLWVVATIATNGWAAARSGRPYDAWLATSLDDEWSARARGLDPLRRLSDRVNAPLLRRLERQVIRGARRLYVTSPASREPIAAAGGLPLDQVRYLPVPVDVDAFAPEEDSAWFARLDAPVLAFVGRADDPRKNVRLLLEALPLIRAAVPGTRLRLIGRPPAGPLPEGVEAAGFVDELAPVLRASSLFVLSSWQEGFGIVAAESLSSGVPVVTTPSGGPESLVHDSGGGAVLGSFAPEELAATVTALLGDTATLARMRRSGREYVVREHSSERFRTLLAEAF